MTKAIPYPIRDGLRDLLVNAGKRLHTARYAMEILKGGEDAKKRADALEEYRNAVAHLEFVESVIRDETGVERERK